MSEPAPLAVVKFAAEIIAAVERADTGVAGKPYVESVEIGWHDGPTNWSIVPTEFGGYGLVAKSHE